MEEFGEEDEVWLIWSEKEKETHEKSIRQLAQEARQGNVHDENVLTYYRYLRRKITTAVNETFYLIFF